MRLERPNFVFFHSVKLGERWEKGQSIFSSSTNDPTSNILLSEVERLTVKGMAVKYGGKIRHLDYREGKGATDDNS